MPNQIVNHYMNNIEITRKAGLANNLKRLIFKNIEVDNFFPRCFELSDKMDYDDFVEDFKTSFVISVLKQYMHGNGNAAILQTCIKIIEKKIECWTGAYNFNKGFESGENIKTNKYIITDKEWDIVSKFDINSKHNSEEYKDQVDTILTELIRINPQYYLNGPRNVWIMKPSGLSRGRGIKCMSNLNDIFKFIKRNSNLYLAQKYIENPLLIMGRKVNTN
jgi:tubulin monoglycylase TTLL3/8